MNKSFVYKLHQVQGCEEPGSPVLKTQGLGRSICRPRRAEMYSHEVQGTVHAHEHLWEHGVPV